MLQFASILFHFYLHSSYLLTIEFRSFSPYGVIFFATNASTNGRQFISLELVNGKLIYQFNSGGGLVQMTTTGDYATGTWTKVVHSYSDFQTQDNYQIFLCVQFHKNTTTAKGYKNDATRRMEIHLSPVAI